MKKILILMLLLLGAFVLTGCDWFKKQPVDDTKEYLVPVEDTDVPYLDDAAGDKAWVCMWADEFKGNVVDEKKWTFETGTGDGGWGNNELQYYRKENAVVEDGVLNINLKKETYGGKNYTSTRMKTQYKGVFTYGRFQASIKFPGGKGTWPAFWMMPASNLYGGWPNSGEIDIVEHVGYDNNSVHSTIHTAKNNGTGKPNEQIGAAKTLTTATSAFHLYELVWEPGYLVFYVDGAIIFQTRYVPALNKDIPYDECFPFDTDFYMILNLAFGGNWGGAQGTDPNITLATMQVEYVRVYQKDYAKIDTEDPGIPKNIALATLSNTIYWNAASDDTAVKQYRIYVDGEFHDIANLYQYTFKTSGSKKISPGAHNIQIKSEDFIGNESDMSEVFKITIK